MHAEILRFIAYRKRSLTARAVNTVIQVLQTLEVGGGELALQLGAARADARRMLPHEVREKLLGKRLKAKGSIIRVGERLYFTPKTLDGVR